LLSKEEAMEAKQKVVNMYHAQENIMFYADEYLARKKGVPEETIIPFKLISFG